MKKFLAALIATLVFAVTLPISAEAQNCRGRKYRKSYAGRNYDGRRNHIRYAARGYSYERPSFYRRHRNLINIGIGTGAGALLGGLIGGRRGVGWGALAGAGGSALYTYKINPKKRRYYRNY